MTGPAAPTRNRGRRSPRRSWWRRRHCPRRSRPARVAATPRQRPGRVRTHGAPEPARTAIGWTIRGGRSAPTAAPAAHARVPEPVPGTVPEPEPTARSAPTGWPAANHPSEPPPRSRRWPTPTGPQPPRSAGPRLVGRPAPRTGAVHAVACPPFLLRATGRSGQHPDSHAMTPPRAGVATRGRHAPHLRPDGCRPIGWPGQLQPAEPDRPSHCVPYHVSVGDVPCWASTPTMVGVHAGSGRHPCTGHPFVADDRAARRSRTDASDEETAYVAG
jgi:hypothetical protein